MNMEGVNVSEEKKRREKKRGEGQGGRLQHFSGEPNELTNRGW